jgi:hypothetical protein
MNKWEGVRAQELELEKRAGEVIWWQFEPMKLRLADGAYYKPDFAVMRWYSIDGRGLSVPVLEFEEVKGFFREAARVRIKVAAEHYPFKFRVIRRRKVQEGGGWDVEEFGTTIYSGTERGR